MHNEPSTFKDALAFVLALALGTYIAVGDWWDRRNGAEEDAS